MCIGARFRSGQFKRNEYLGWSLGARLLSFREALSFLEVLMHCSWSVARGYFSYPGEHVRAFSDDRAPSFHDLYVGVRSQC